MSIEELKNKSLENLETGVWAEKKSYYNAAISRYYYSEYQKIIYISKKGKFYVKPEKSDSSHVKTIDNFVSSLNDRVTNEDKISLLKMKKLRGLRNDADYEEKRMESNDFNLLFKYHYNIISDITNKLL